MKTRVHVGFFCVARPVFVFSLALLLGAFSGALTTYATPAPSPMPSASAAPPPAPKCECDAGTYRIEDKGRCFLQTCIASKDKLCTMSGVTKTFLNPGTWAATNKEIPCNPAPSGPPSSSSPTQGGGGPPPKPPVKASPTPTPTATPEALCPGPDDENEFGLVGDGGKIGECEDGNGEPIPNIPPVEDPDVPGLCYWALRYCVGGCWFYDVHGVNPVPDECP
jgi:hypothetical protein